MICPSHGVIWRDNPLQIVQKYAEWANQYKEDQVTVIYDTMYNGTRAIAENIVRGITLANEKIKVKLFNAARNDNNDIITEIFKSKAILMGSPTVNNGILSSIAGLLEMIEGLKFKNKKAAVFGCYGWHDSSTKIIEKRLSGAGFELIKTPVTSTWQPDQENLEKCVNYGIEFAGLLNQD